MVQKPTNRLYQWYLWTPSTVRVPKIDNQLARCGSAVKTWFEGLNALTLISISSTIHWAKWKTGVLSRSDFWRCSQNLSTANYCLRQCKIGILKSPHCPSPSNKSSWIPASSWNCAWHWLDYTRSCIIYSTGHWCISDWILCRYIHWRRSQLSELL